ncbi:hypothetical protein LTR65_003798 [Meristemomyces frigidus]
MAEIERKHPTEPVAYFRAKKVRDRFQYLWHYSGDQGKKLGTPSRLRGDFVVERKRKETTWVQRRKDKQSLFTPSRWESAARHVLATRGKRAPRSWLRKLRERGGTPAEWRLCALQRRRMRRHRLFEARTGLKGDGRRMVGWGKGQGDAVAEKRWKEAAAKVKSPSQVKRTQTLERPSF